MLEKKTDDLFHITPLFFTKIANITVMLSPPKENKIIQNIINFLKTMEHYWNDVGNKINLISPPPGLSNESDEVNQELIKLLNNIESKAGKKSFKYFLVSLHIAAILNFNKDYSQSKKISDEVLSELDRLTNEETVFYEQNSNSGNIIRYPGKELKDGLLSIFLTTLSYTISVNIRNSLIKEKSSSKEIFEAWKSSEAYLKKLIVLGIDECFDSVNISHIYNSLGNVKKALEEFEEAKIYYKLSIFWNEKYEKPYAELADLYILLGYNDEACRLYKSAIEKKLVKTLLFFGTKKEFPNRELVNTQMQWNLLTVLYPYQFLMRARTR